MGSSLEQLLIDAGALKEGHFLLASGLHSNRYIEKFDLLRHPAATSRALEEMANRYRDSGIDVVAGPTTGGVILAFELARQLGVHAAYAERVADGAPERTFKRSTSFAPGSRVLVVDDILTTGGSIRETLAALEQQPVEVAGVAVLVDRSAGAVQFPGLELFPLLSLKVDAWPANECPLCADNVPLVKPGSTAVTTT